MKKIGSVVDGLKLIIKYGAYIIVVVDVLQYALNKFQALDKDNDEPVKKEVQNVDTIGD